MVYLTETIKSFYLLAIWFDDKEDEAVIPILEKDVNFFIDNTPSFHLKND